MRNRRRPHKKRVTLAGAWLLALAAATCAWAGNRDDDNAPVRLAVEITWSGPALPRLPAASGSDEPTPAGPIDLSISGGRVIDAVNWPAPTGVEAAPFSMYPISSPPGPRPDAPGTWRLGLETSGRVRLLVEAPIDAVLLVDAGGQRTQFPLTGLIEGPQQTLPQAAVSVQIERLRWDGLTMHLGEGNGLYAPGGHVPLTVGFNILTPEAGQVGVRYSAELRPIRGGAAVWRIDPAPEVLPTNQTVPPGRVLSVMVPEVEGTYILEVRATWEPAAGALEGSRLVRWLRRRRATAPVTVVRQCSLTVLAPSYKPISEIGATGEVIDLGAGRPRAAGRSRGVGDESWSLPEAALVAPGLRDRLRGWISRGEAELGPADPSGLAWTALPLPVARPGRPHELRVTIAGGDPESLGVALVVPGREGVRPRLVLDARGSGPVLADDETARVLTWPVWPDASEAVLVLVNRGQRGGLRLRSVELAPRAGDPEPAALVEVRHDSSRVLALDVSTPGALDRLGATVDGVPTADVLNLASNLAAYLAQCGGSAAVLPDAMADRDRRSRLDGQAAEDSTAPDALDLALQVLARRGMSALVRVELRGSLAGLPPVGSDEARAQGLVRVDAQGRSEGVYQLLHPEVRAALAARLGSAVSPRLTHPNLLGAVVSLGTGPMLPGSSDGGLDDSTFAQFARSSFPAAGGPRVPGLESDAPDRFAARATFVTGPARRAWAEWRAARLAETYEVLTRAVAEAAPGASLALVTPGLDAGPAQAEARRVDQVGRSPEEAWRAVGLDLSRWPNRPGGPIVVRGVALASGELAEDLATSPELDQAVATRPVRGFGLLDPNETPAGLALTAAPARAEELLTHAVASLDPQWTIVGMGAAAGREETLARFARVYRALPAPPETPLIEPRLPSGVAVRSWQRQGRTYLVVANDTPYEVLQATRVNASPRTLIDDLGRGVRLEPAEAEGGGQSLVLRLPAFGLTAVRIAEPSATVEPLETYLPNLATLEAQAEGLATRLGRAAQGEGLVGPPLAGFEPPSVLSNATTAAPLPSIPALPAESSAALAAAPGWTVIGPGSSLGLDTDRPRSGTSALRLDAAAPPASAASDSFLPPGGRALTARMWLRTDRPDRPIRVWLEGQADGQSIIRRADLTAGTDWTETRLRLLDLPPGGLDSLRVRYEWLGSDAGTLWVDDLDLTGEQPSEPGRRAHRALLEALQAYRARRYSDFARLLRSQHTRHAMPSTEEPTEEAMRTGRSTDLSPGRRLR